MSTFARVRVILQRAVTGIVTGGSLCEEYVKDHTYGNQLAIVKIREQEKVLDSAHNKKFTSEQVSAHDNKDSIWVTYKDGVYDVTKFLDQHPGGKRFLLSAAGGAVDGMWQFWHFHHTSPLVPRYLEQYRIGTLIDWEEDESPIDLFENDPDRCAPSKQSVLLDRPYNSQTTNSILTASYLTPADALYVRNHGPVPTSLKADNISFEISTSKNEAPPGTKGAIDTADTQNTQNIAHLNLSELQAKFGTKKITAVLQCGGSRAREDLAVNGVSGFAGTNYESITNGMLGNGLWEGIPLAPVLHDLLNDVNVENKFIEFHGADEYFSSIPLAYALDPANDCLLVTKLNDQPLPPDHGAPLRIIIPGNIGARSVKWLQRIVIRNDEGLSPWNCYYYNDKSLPKKNFTFQSGHSLQLQSLILESRAHHLDNNIFATGIAYSGKGHDIDRVEISIDFGKSWHQAKIRTDEILQDDAHKSWHWIRWYSMIPGPKVSKVPPRKNPHDPKLPPPDDVNVPVLARDSIHPSATFIKTAAPPPLDNSLPQVWCRASTIHGETQPPESIRRGGYNFNGYHRVYIEPPASSILSLPSYSS
mmetsp:Transcript_19252/g.24992  ORF Transcript_19252/g.24992 Transcript_19252/m.24992 type:complete len:588 (-) Transcript_19252:187-1950(-)